MPSITLHDVAPATFAIMLRFIYTDALPGDEELGDSPSEMLQDLLAMADLYALERLKILCAKKLWDGLAVDNVAANLASAEMFNCAELKNKCFAFLAEEENNLKKAELTEEFVQLRQKFPSIFDELKEKMRPYTIRRSKFHDRDIFSWEALRSRHEIFYFGEDASKPATK